MSEFKYNLRKDPVDERDFLFAGAIAPVRRVKKPRKVDLRKDCPPVLNQLSLGSCTANAGTSARAMLKGDKYLSLSRLYLYYKERELEGTVNEDSGATMRSICKVFNKTGCCCEELFPYDISKFMNIPSSAADADAPIYKIAAYRSLQSIQQIKDCLALRQQPVLCGMEVYSQLENMSEDGKLRMPAENEKVLGGHAVLIVGYVDSIFPGRGYFIVRNSWGEFWGDNGYFYMSYEYITSGHAWDFWTLE